MRVKILSQTSKGKENKSAHDSVGGVGKLYFPVGRMQIPTEKGGYTLTTSRVQKITVETKNSIYELEVVEDIKEEDENE